MNEQQRLKRNAYMREWYKKKTKDKEFRARDNKNKNSWYHKNHQRAKDIARTNRHKMKRELFEAYGNKCACCGEATFEFLTLDHPNKDGCKHRQEIGETMQQLYRWHKEGAREYELRVLCFNCHWAITFHKTCPHTIQS